MSNPYLATCLTKSNFSSCAVPNCLSTSSKYTLYNPLLNVFVNFIWKLNSRRNAGLNLNLFVVISISKYLDLNRLLFLLFMKIWNPFNSLALVILNTSLNVSSIEAWFGWIFPKKELHSSQTFWQIFFPPNDFGTEWAALSKDVSSSFFLHQIHFFTCFTLFVYNYFAFLISEHGCIPNIPTSWEVWRGLHCWCRL